MTCSIYIYILYITTVFYYYCTFMYHMYILHVTKVQTNCDSDSVTVLVLVHFRT